MNKKRLAIIIVLTIIVSIVIIVLTGMYEKNYNKRINNEQKIIDEIKEKYKDFQKTDENAVNKRESIYKDYSSFFSYFDSMKSKYNEVLKAYKEYDELVQKTKEDAEYLLDKCVGFDYMDSKVVQNCYVFSRNYEQTANYFVEDVNLFNAKIKEYNEYVKNDKNKVLKEYTTDTFTDYVDIDKDGIYLGKNVE